MPTVILTRPDSGWPTSITEPLDRLGVQAGEQFTVGAGATKARARRSDPDTSHAAAATVDDLRQSQKDVLAVFESVGRSLTDEELIKAHERAVRAGDAKKQSPSGIRSRRAELVDAGFVTDTGVRGRISTGRFAAKWALAGAPVSQPPVEGGVPTTGPALMRAVLTQAGGPLPVRDIVDRVLALDESRTDGNRVFQGKTPAATIAAQLATSHTKAGDFIRTSPGHYALREGGAAPLFES